MKESNELHGIDQGLSSELYWLSLTVQAQRIVSTVV